MKVTSEQFKGLLPSICDKETSSDPDNWTPENPLWGHCAVASLVAQNLFGGKLARASLEDTEFSGMDSHYWNILPDGTGKDFSVSQFQDKKLVLTVSERTREYVLYDPKTGKPREIMKRYKLLAYRLAKSLSNNNPLFDDPIYRKCFYSALDSPCQKMLFGCFLRYYHDYERVGVAYWQEIESCNKTIQPLKSICEPMCIRFNIQSRTESMIGACGHAEELILAKAAKEKLSLSECEIYVAGLYNNGLPYIKTEPVFTCLRCAVQIYNFGVKKIYVPVVDKWVALSAEQALETARAYATGEKKV